MFGVPLVAAFTDMCCNRRNTEEHGARRRVGRLEVGSDAQIGIHTAAEWDRNELWECGTAARVMRELERAPKMLEIGRRCGPQRGRDLMVSLAWYDLSVARAGLHLNRTADGKPPTSPRLAPM